jgi:hypothetical protein
LDDVALEMASGLCRLALFDGDAPRSIFPPRSN